MNEENKKPQEDAGEKKQRLSLRNIFYHNTFVLIFSFCVALIMWFVMSSTTTEGNRRITDVPITQKLSAAAEEDGLRIFNMSYNSVDLEISGSSLITNKLTADDFDVSVTLNPTSTKLTGNTLQKMTVPVRAVKNTTISDYNIESVSPEEINVEYDRYKEVTLAIENEIKYSAESGYYPGTATLSEENVTISGPESSVNKISRAVIGYTVENQLKSETDLTCPIRLYDQNNQEITDTASLYLVMSADTVDVNIPILPKKTVNIVANTVHQPSGFADSRVTVEPAQIEIAGPQEVLAGITEIQLDTPIDFADLDITKKNVFTMDIPLPSGVKNISSVGDNTVSQATVSINLNGYKEAKVTVPAANIQIVNTPAGKEPSLTTQSLEVTLIGSEAQVSKLTGDSISVQADLTNFSDRTGSVEVPVVVTISGSGVDSCWVMGKYKVFVSITDKTVVMTNTRKVEESSAEDVAATPQE